MAIGGRILGAVRQQRLRPRLQGNRRAFSGRRRDDAATGQPDALFCRRCATQEDSAVRRTRRRLRRRTRRTPAPRTALTPGCGPTSVRYADLHVGAATPLSLRLCGLALWRRVRLPLGRLLREERGRRQRQQHRSRTQNETMWSHLAVS